MKVTSPKGSLDWNDLRDVAVDAIIAGSVGGLIALESWINGHEVNVAAVLVAVVLPMSRVVRRWLSDKEDR